ncbi:MAG: phospholipase D-like domain-containing protein [Elusimicrobiota bacterium]|jgi:phosphatidylserine/phosphatidylglycerophosphate/cardiolipin synthase-like enzyme
MNKRFFWAGPLILLAVCGHAAFQVPGYELVYSYPVETSLAEPDMRPAREVWPQMLDAARTSIDLNQFYVSPAPGEALDATLAALARAGRRGVHIRVILEKKFAPQSREGLERLRKMPNLEVRMLDWAQVAGAGIVHAKYFVVDSARAFVGSQNFDWRSLQHIHEMGLAVADGPVVRQIQIVFDHDWKLAGSTGPFTPDHVENPRPDRSRRAYLVASPWRFDPPGVGDSESELIRLIGEAQAEVVVQVFKYEPLTFVKPQRLYPIIDNALRDAAVRGVRVKLLVSDWSADAAALPHLRSLAALPNIEVRVITIPPARGGPIPYARLAHSKYMVVDGRTLWLGTSNWMGGYLDDSRNLEVVLKDQAMAGRAASVHKRLWDSSYAVALDTTCISSPYTK